MRPRPNRGRLSGRGLVPRLKHRGCPGDLGKPPSRWGGGGTAAPEPFGNLSFPVSTINSKKCREIGCRIAAFFAFLLENPFPCHSSFSYAKALVRLTPV